MLLLQYVAEANNLKDNPAFYNSITTNCTTAVAKLIRTAGGTLPLDWRLIVNGYLPGYLYDRRRRGDRRFRSAELMALAAHRRARQGRRPVSRFLGTHPGRRPDAERSGRAVTGRRRVERTCWGGWRWVKRALRMNDNFLTKAR